MLLKYFIAFSALWLLLTKGDISSWIIGVFAVSAATWLCTLLTAPRTTSTPQSINSRGLSLLGLLRFIPFFLWQSLLGGWQTAWLALHPRLPLAPGSIIYQTRLPPGSARDFFLHVISLMPGTLSAQLSDDQLHVHALSNLEHNEKSLQHCEQQVAALFGGNLFDEGTQSE